jgi:hypothetical protein
MQMSERLLRVPDVARILGLDGAEVYALIDRRELRAGKGPDGLVYVPERAVEDYRRRHATSSP